MMRTLAEWPFKQKREVVKWSGVPRLTCDLNFRPPGWEPSGRIHTSGTLLIGVSLGSVLAAWMMRNVLGAFLDSSAAAFAGCLAGALLAMWVLVDGTWTGNRTLTHRLAAAGLCLPAGPVLWFVIVVHSRLDVLAGSFAVLALVALPVVAITADRFATHYLHWMTAHYRIDRQTMLGWRSDWDRRFAGFPHRPPRKPNPSRQELQAHAEVLRLRDEYLSGFIRFAGALILPPVVIVCAAALDLLDLVGPMIVAGQLAALAGLAVVTVPSDASRVFAAAWEHWCRAGRNQHTVPWMFQSPSGPQRVRLLWLILSASLLAVTLVPIAGTWTVRVDPAAGGETGIEVLAARWRAFTTDWLVPVVHGIAEGRFHPVGHLLLRTAVAALLPPAVLLLGLYVITGAVLVAHDRALERRGAYEQHPRWTALDGYSDRLRHSRNRQERDCLMMGSVSFHQ